MSDAYRDDHEAALRHIDALERENRALRARIERAESGDSRPAKTHGHAALALITGVFFLAGAVTVAGASRSHCASSRGSSAPCPYAAARAASAFERGEQLLRNEPGSVRVELAPGSESARVAVDGVAVPRSGRTALSGPLAGGATHVVDVRAPGFTGSRTRVWVAPGRTEVVRVRLEPDGSPQDDEPIEAE